MKITREAIPGIAAGVLVVFMLAAGALILLFQQRKAVGTEPARIPLETITAAAAAEYFVIGVILLYGRVVWQSWWPAESGARTTWFQPVFFGARVVVYYFALVFSVHSLKKRDGAPERLLLAPMVMVVASYDFIIGMHSPAPFWSARSCGCR